MKRLIFLIWFLTISIAVADNNKTVVIGDTTYFNYTHTSAIDSAQLILIRGAVNDTFSLMPITGSSHKICLWGPGIFNQVDSAGDYNVWIEPYSSGAIIDTVLGDCLVELAALTVNEIAAYPEYEFKMVATGSPTTLSIPVSYIDPSPSTEANDFCLGMLLVSQGGNSNKKVVTVADFTIADSTFTVRPGFQSAPNSGDTIFILPGRGAVEPNPWTNHEIWLSGTGRVTAETLETGVYATVDTNSAGDSIAIQPEYWTADDTTAYQGSAAGLDSGAVAGAVRDVLGDSIPSIQEIGEFTGNWGQAQFEDSVFDDATFQAGSFYPNIFADNAINTDVIKDGTFDSLKFTESYWHKIANRADSGAGAASGTGVNVCSLWVYDTGNTVMVSGIMVQAENSSGANQGRNRTNVSGISVLNLNDGSYFLRIPMNSGYIQTTNPQPFTVSGATNDTIDVTWFSPSDPGGDLCAVYNYIKDANDNGIAGIRITATIPTNFWPITYEGQAIKATYTTTTDGNGLWQTPVFPSGLLLTADGDSASFYNYTASNQLFGPMGIKVTVPDSASFFMVPDEEQ